MTQEEQQELNRQRDQMRGEMYADIKHMVRWTEEHDKKDDVRFSDVGKEFDFVKKFIYGGVGIFIFVEFVVKLIK